MPKFETYPEKESPAEGDFLLVLDGDDDATKKVDVGNLPASLPNADPFQFDLGSWTSGYRHYWAATHEPGAPYYGIYQNGEADSFIMFGAYLDVGRTGRAELEATNDFGYRYFVDTLWVFGEGEASNEFARTGVSASIDDDGTSQSAVFIADVSSGESVYLGVIESVPKLGLYDATNTAIFEVLGTGAVGGVTPSNGHVIKWNGTKWVAAAP